MSKHKFNMQWKDDVLTCACLFGNARCGNYRSCEVEILDYDPFNGSEQCMKARKYKRNKHGALEEIK